MKRGEPTEREGAPPATSPKPTTWDLRFRIAWGLVLSAILAWLAGSQWTGRRPAGWPAGTPILWGSGEREWSNPFHGMRLERWGSTVAVEEAGNWHLQVPPISTVELGRFPEGASAWTLAFWVRIPSNATPVSRISFDLASLTGPEYRSYLGITNGQVFFEQTVRDPAVPGRWTTKVAVSTADTVPLGRWFLLSLAVDPAWMEIRIDGRLLSARQGWGNGEPVNASLRLCGEAPRGRLSEYGSWLGFPGGEVGRWLAETASRGQEHFDVAYDDVVLFDYRLTGTAVEALRARGLGGYPEVFLGRERRIALTRDGWPWAIGAVVVLAVLQAAGPLRRVLPALVQPLFRPAAAVLCGGLLLTGLAYQLMDARARRLDAAKAEEMYGRIQRVITTQVRGHMRLVNAFRDWIAEGDPRGPDELKPWLRTRSAEESLLGFAGIGYAEQVPSGSEATASRIWSDRHGFDFRIEPPLAPADPFPERLIGKPRLPVVLYQPRALPEEYWRTNHTVLGLDLLRRHPRAASDGPGPERIALALAMAGTVASGVEPIAPAEWRGREVRGIRLYAPVQRQPPKDKVRITPAEWRGVAFVDIDFERILRPEISHANPEFGLEVRAGTAESSRGDILYQSVRRHPRSARPEDPAIQRSGKIAIQDSVFWFDLWATDHFRDQSERRIALWVSGCGVVFTLLATQVLFLQIRERRHQAEMLERLQSANRRLAQAHRERARLSRDLHDGTVQNLYAVGLHLQHALRNIDQQPPRAREGLEAGQRLVQETLVELREFLLTIKDESSSHRTFAEILQGLVDRLQRSLPVRFELAIAVDTRNLPRRSVLHLANLVREAVSNSLRHAEPTRITIRLQPGSVAGWFHLEIADDGRGFDVAQSRKDGFGMVTLLERASELRGALTLDSTPGAGTVLKLQFPERPGDESSL